ncbi:hypothetical protein [Marisediminicola sp. LYQ134]|uniref:hypothetical protein n=1 Tax=Marisediminicola sp. LYQ134 TaxID=3391061 RepID=UPI003983D640
MRFAPRRSTVLIAVAVALVAVTAIVSLTLVQRVQTDPLQVGATQVARLSVDPDYDAPAILSGARARGLVAYDDFYGLRAVVQERSRTSPDDECMIIYQPELLEVSDSGYSYSGQMLLRACAAGVFPAAIALPVPSDFPEELREAYPEGTPLQFVYDRGNNEIVVFKG